LGVFTALSFLAPVKANGDAPHETIAPSTNGEPTRVLEPWDGGGDGSDIGGIEVKAF